MEKALDGPVVSAWEHAGRLAVMHFTPVRLSFLCMKCGCLFPRGAACPQGKVFCSSSSRYGYGACGWGADFRGKSPKWPFSWKTETPSLLSSSISSGAQQGISSEGC